MNINQVLIGGQYDGTSGKVMFPLWIHANQAMSTYSKDLQGKNKKCFLEIEIIGPTSEVVPLLHPRVLQYHHSFSWPPIWKNVLTLYFPMNSFANDMPWTPSIT